MRSYMAIPQTDLDREDTEFLITLHHHSVEKISILLEICQHSAITVRSQMLLAVDVPVRTVQEAIGAGHLPILDEAF
jgi:hypothetical protein